MARDHEHRWFLTTTKNAFEPVPQFKPDGEPVETADMLYRIVEYAYLICNCGDIKKEPVQQPGGVIENVR